MLNKIQKEILKTDCTINGVSYTIKDMFIIPNKKYLIAIVRENGMGNRNSENFYSIISLENIKGIKRNTTEYQEIIKDFPDCKKLKTTSTEPIKIWKYEKQFSEIFDEYLNGNYSKEKYKEYLNNMKNIKNDLKNIYDYFLNEI